MSACALTPTNQGDGVPGHPVPAPTVYTCTATPWTGAAAGMDYMTYNARVSHVMSASTSNCTREKLLNTWSYLARFFRPMKPLANPNDRINLDACLVPFTTSVATSSSTWSGRIAGPVLYEPQLLGRPR